MAIADIRNLLRRYVLAILVFALGFGATVTAYVLMVDTDRRWLESELHLQIDAHAGSLRQGIDRYVDLVTAIRAFVAGSDGVVSRRDFMSLAASVRNEYAAVQTLGWVPRVRADLRPAYETTMRDEGVPNFHFSELAPNGDLVPAAERAEYFPLYLVDGVKSNPRIHGFDMSTQPERREAMERARDTGQAAVTAGVRMMSGSDDQRVILIFAPLYLTVKTPEAIADRREALIGFTVGVFHIGEMIEQILVHDTNIRGFDHYFFDDAAMTSDHLVYVHGARNRPAGSYVPPLESVPQDARILKVLAVADREWTMVTVVPADIFPNRSDPDTWVALLVGFVGSMAIALLLGVMIDRNGRLRATARNLQAATEQLKSEIDMRKQTEVALQFSNSLQKTAQESSPDGILVVDSAGRIVNFNGRFVDMWKVPHELVDAGHDEPVLATVTSRLKDPEKFLARVRFLYEHPEENGHDELELADGRTFDRHTAVLRDLEGLYLGRIWFFRDITERKLAAEQIAKMARFDALTGLANRTVFVEQVQRAIAWSHRDGPGFAVLYLDLDHFKDVNDTLGHPVGDSLLQLVGERLRSHMRETDTVARFGGDEFAVLAAVKEAGDAGLLSAKLIDVISAPYMIDGNEIRIGTSIGIAVFGPENMDAESMLSHADLALYRAKSEGRRSYRFFTDAMDVAVRTRVTLAAELRTALSEGQLFLEYQPQVRVKDGKILGFEALVRWHHPVRGLLGPGEFIPAAERGGLIVALGEWTLREACRQAKEWIDAGLDLPMVSVNVSAIQFKSPGELESGIQRILKETGLPAAQLEVEMTETALMDASREHGEVLRRIQTSGIRIALDDFGTGYSSLSYLRRFPVDRIKIAQEFVRDMTADNGDAVIVKAAIGLALALGIDVIAEGVETAEQLERLTQWGCGAVQGYYFARPLAAAAVPDLLRRGRVDGGKGALAA